MRRIPSNLLPTADSCPHHVYHESGVRLFKKGEPVTPEHIDLLHECVIGFVYLRERGDDIDDFVRNARFEKTLLSGLGGGRALALPVYDDAGRLLVDRGTRCDANTRRYLAKQGVQVVHVVRDRDIERYALRFLELRRAAEVRARRRKVTSIHMRRAKLLLNPKVSPEEVHRQSSAADPEAQPVGVPLERLVDAEYERRVFSDDEKRRCSEVFGKAVGHIAELYQRVESEEKIHGDALVDTVREVLMLLVGDKDLLLNMLNEPSEGDFLPFQVVKTAIAAVNIATSLGYGDEQVLEIGFGALLADIGMMRVDKRIRDKAGPLTVDELAEVHTHPERGLALLRLVSGVPRSALFVVYQSHERFNGTGYPREISGEHIHPYARIVACADAYVAIASQRPYREGMLPYKSMEEVVRGASKRTFDSKVVRSMLQYLSLFPVGSWVELSNGTVGRVVAANKSSYARPVVQMLYNADNGEPLSSSELSNLAKNPRLRVVRAVDGTRYAENGRWHGF